MRRACGALPSSTSSAVRRLLLLATLLVLRVAGAVKPPLPALARARTFSTSHGGYLFAGRAGAAAALRSCVGWDDMGVLRLQKLFHLRLLRFDSSPFTRHRPIWLATRMPQMCTNVR